MAESPARRIRIAGLGLIGGSLGIALGRSGWIVEFLDPAVGEGEARRAGAARRKLESVDPADPSPLVIATPVDVAILMLREEDFGRAAVTSVASVMEPLRRAAAERGVDFVAGHPFAGRESRTLAAADPDLFRGRTWFVDGSRDSGVVEAIVADCGAVVHRIDPADHDRALALASHLPQALSTALGALVDERALDDAVLGSGLATFLRLAGSDHSVWRPVLEENRENVRASAAELRRILERILDGDSVEAFARAQRTYERLARKHPRGPGSG